MLTPVNNRSAQPYLLRAIHEWCCDGGMTPYLAVAVDATVQVPGEYVNNNEIVLNISLEATSNFRITNELVQFRARFGGVARDISVPVGRVLAIYGRESGEGLVFPVVNASDAAASGSGVDKDGPDTFATGSKLKPVGASSGGEVKRGSAAEGRQSGQTDESDPLPPLPPEKGGSGTRAKPALRRVK